MGTSTTGQIDIRKNFYDTAIKQLTMRMYKFKQAVAIAPTSAWKNFFYRESQTTLSGPTGNAIKGIPRLAAFPQASVSWERVSSVLEKYGLEESIAWEDILTNDIPVRDRTLIRIAEGVAKAVDDEIYDVLTESDNPTNIQTFTTSAGWNESSAAIIDDLEHAEQLMGESDYDTDNILVFINYRDKRSVIKFLTDKGAQFPRISEDAARNGSIGKLGNKSFVVSRSVSASRALVVIPKRCATWREATPLQTNVEEDPFKSVRIRAVEMGVTQLTDPKAVVLIKGTQGP